MTGFVFYFVFFIWDTPLSSMPFESWRTLTKGWQSSAICCSVKLGSFSSSLRILRLISASLLDTKPCAKIKHLKLLVLNSDYLKSSQCLFTSLSFLVRFMHFHFLWKRDVLGLNNSLNNCTASVNVRSLGFWVIYNWRIWYVQLYLNFLVANEPSWNQPSSRSQCLRGLLIL